MSKRKNRDKGIMPDPFKNLDQETKTSTIGVLFVGISIVFILSSIGAAGPVGDFIFSLLSKFFGLGYYLIPAALIALSIAFFVGETRRFLGNTFMGVVLFLLSALGLLDIVYDGNGGILGNFFGSLQKFFGYEASIILNLTFLIAAALIALNVPLRFNWLIRLFMDDASEKKDSKGRAQKTNLGNGEYTENELKEIEKAESEARAKKFETKSDEATDGKRLAKEVRSPEIVVAKPREDVPRLGKTTANFKDYIPPPSDLLKSSIDKPGAGDLRANSNIIKRTLESFGIPVEMGEITIGPKVTRYTLKPAEGVKLSKITALNQDLSLALAVHPIRIEAPIPGKSLVGIEIPNKTASIVRLGSLIGYAEFIETPNLLTFVLGRDVSGDPVYGNLAKMPHLLIAGTTGSGKSVMIHSLLMSLIYKNSPETMRLILIDPKRVELPMYSNIPHLITPVITDGKKAIATLRFAIEEMDKRYGLLAASGKRDIASYNEGKKEGKIPYLVLVIDELADLMVTFGREIENSIVRLAQMARATGIHLVLSTQRPSVDVITGLIKANISSRIALQVASQVDSKTILDMSGAEKLLGGGDMLFISSELSKPKRIQGAYVTVEEISSVVDFITKKNPLHELDDLGKRVEETLEKKNGSSSGGADEDELYKEAIETVRAAQKASASLLQRRLGVGYARAARLLDIMEENGIVGPGEGAKPREVFVEKNPE